MPFRFDNALALEQDVIRGAIPIYLRAPDLYFVIGRQTNSEEMSGFVYMFLYLIGF